MHRLVYGRRANHITVTTVTADNAHESLSLCMKSGNEKVAMPFDLFDFIELYRV